MWAILLSFRSRISVSRSRVIRIRVHDMFVSHRISTNSRPVGSHSQRSLIGFATIACISVKANSCSSLLFHGQTFSGKT